jgi:hypothetical protein
MENITPRRIVKAGSLEHVSVGIGMESTIPMNPAITKTATANFALVGHSS